MKKILGPYTLAQLARAVGVSVDDVQRYRQHGVLQPPRRRRGRSDDLAFHEEHVERLCFIKRAVELDFTLDDVSRLVEPGALVTCGDVYNLVAHHLDEVRQARGPDAAVVVALEDLIATCAARGSRRDCQVLTALADCKSLAD